MSKYYCLSYMIIMFFIWKDKSKLLNKFIFNDAYNFYVDNVLLPLLKFSRTYLADNEKIIQLQELALKIIMGFEMEMVFLKKENKNDSVHLYERLKDITKSILDWILRRNLLYNRAYISFLSYSKWPGYLKNDIRYSINKVKKQYLKAGNVIIVNDLTQSSRIGDYLIINNGKIINILETKKNGKVIRGIQKMNSMKTDRQWTKILDTFNKINDNVGIKSTVLSKNYLSKVENIIKKTYKSWCEINRLNSLTSIRVIYTHTTKQIDYKKLINQSKKAKKFIQNKDSDEILHISNLDFFAKRHNRFITSTIAPYSVFPFDNTTCMDLMSWVLQLSTYINISILKKEFIKNWWIVYEENNKIEVAVDDMNASNFFYENNVDTSIFKVRKDDWYFSTVSIHIILLIGLEFRNYKEILDMYENFYQESKLDKKNKWMLLNFLNDRNIFY